MKRHLVAASLGSIALLTPAASRAQSFDVTGGYARRADDPPHASSASAPPTDDAPTEPAASPFGSAGQIVVSTAATTAYVSSTQYDGSQASFLSAGFSPGFDYFVARHVSIGLDLEAYYSKNQGYGADSSLVQTTSTSFSAGPRFGVDIPLGERVSFYPRFTFGVESLHQTSSLVSGQSVSLAGATGSLSQTNTGAWINAFTPLLFHPRPHFFIGAGPRVFHSFAKTVTATGVGGERTTLGASLVIGGYWGGDIASDAPALPAIAPTRHRRFGDAGVVVLTGQMSASVQSLTYGGSNAQYLTVGFAPGFDVFVARHFSIGVDLGTSYSSGTGYGSDGAKIDYSQTSFGLAPRLGVDIPFSDLLSLYPRAEVGFGSTTQDATSSAGSENKHTFARTWISAEAPLIVHAASHFFVGAGPTVSHELSASDQNGISNRATTVGASVLIGGWL